MFSKNDFFSGVIFELKRKMEFCSILHDKKFITITLLTLVMSTSRFRKTPPAGVPQPAVVDSAINDSADNDVTSLAEDMDSRLTINNIDPTKKYFVYFIHESGRRGDNMPVKVGVSNDVGEYRKELEKERENGLKTYIAIKCVKGDAEAVAESFKQKFTSSHLKNGWFTGGKAMIDAFVDGMAAMGYEKVTEGRAKVLKSARKPAAKKAAN